MSKSAATPEGPRRGR